MCADQSFVFTINLHLLIINNHPEIKTIQSISRADVQHFEDCVVVDITNTLVFCVERENVFKAPASKLLVIAPARRMKAGNNFFRHFERCVFNRRVELKGFRKKQREGLDCIDEVKRMNFVFIVNHNMFVSAVPDFLANLRQLLIVL